MCKAIRDLMDDSREKGREEGREEGVSLFVRTLREFHVSDQEIVKRIMREFSMEQESAEKYIL